jgi:hypothetical protein
MAVTIDGTNGINDTVLGSSTPAAANVTTLGASGEVTATGFTGTLDGVLGGGTPAAANVTTLAVAGDVTGVTGINSGQIGGRRNIIYNGEMKVAQRSASVAGLGAAGGYFTLDRWKIVTAASAGRLTMAQVADGPPGFANSMKFSTTTADTSIAAGEYLLLVQDIEGQDLQQLKKGTASAEQVTVSFWVKGNAAALYVCEIQDLDTVGGRVNTQSFAVTTSWNRIELTFAADTTGALVDDNTAGLALNFWLHAGATYAGGTFAGDNTWAGITQANRAAVDGFTSIYDATSRTLFITGVQWELGATATEFESRTFGEELALCERYYETSNGAGAPFAATDGYVVTTISGDFPTFSYRVGKRAGVTLATSFAGGTGAAFVVGSGSFYQAVVHSVPSTFGWTASSEL